ncbi:DUF5327 family protein [Staphylococcus auricularis]|uniref:DUF5327 family protein n=1 Tax=Staphylococcus auricularis TaxID=29379 RepID=UPI003EBBDCF4
MNKDKMIQLIEQELVQADEATSSVDFEKHMYAIHALTSLYTEGAASHDDSQSTTSKPSTFSTQSQSSSTSQSSAKNQVTAAEIKAMGGEVPASMKQRADHTSSLPSNQMITDDEIGNGDSIFDF